MTWPPNWSRLWLVNAHTAFIRLLIQHFQFVSGVSFYKLNKFFKFQLLLCTLLIMCLFDSYWWRVLSDIICWRNNLFDSMHMLFWFWIFHYFIFYSSVKLFMGVHQKKMSFQKKLQFHFLNVRECTLQNQKISSKAHLYRWDHAMYFSFRFLMSRFFFVYSISAYVFFCF